MTEINSAREVLKTTCKKLLSHANVVATGIGYKVSAGQKTSTLSIICSVTQKPPVTRLSERDKVPASMDGIPTDIVLTGPLWAQANADAHRLKLRRIFGQKVRSAGIKNPARWRGFSVRL